MFTLKRYKSVILIIAVMVYALTAWNSEGYIQEDEHYQIIEFASYKLGGITPNALPWEYHAAIRSGFQPLLAFAIFSMADLAGIDDPYILSFFLRLITAIFALIVISLFSKQQTKYCTDKETLWYYSIAFLLWFMPFLSVRFSSEVWGGLFFAFALYNYFNKPTPAYMVIAGVLMCFSFLCRFQMGFMILGLLLWMIFIKQEKRNYIAGILIGISISVFIGVLIDKWLYGKWTVSFYNYFIENIVHDKASYYGTAPWYAYFKYILVQPFLPVGVVLLLSLLIVIIKDYKSWPTWIILFFLVGHMIVPHKELRFLFPLVYFIPLTLLLAYKHVAVSINKYWVRYTITIALLVFFLCILNVVGLVAVAFRAAGQRESITHFIARQYHQKPIHLFYTKYSDIYTPELPAQFYKRSNTVYHQIDSVSVLHNISPDTSVVNLFACLKTELYSANFNQYKKVYQSMPEWIEKLGIMTKTINPMQIIELYQHEK